MKTFLIAYLLVNGTWELGDPELGWKPVPYPTETECLNQKRLGELSNQILMDNNPRMIPVRFACVEEKPA